MCPGEAEVLSVLQALVRTTAQETLRVLDESLPSEKHTLIASAVCEVNTFLEMQVKEAAEKICRLFCDTSAGLALRLTQSIARNNLKRKLKQVVKMHKKVSREKQEVNKIPSKIQTGKSKIQTNSALCPSWREEEGKSVNKPEVLTPTVYQLTRKAGFMGIKEESLEQSSENTISNGKLRANDEDNMCWAEQIDASSEMDVSVVTGLSNVRETWCINTQPRNWKSEGKLSCKSCKRTFIKLMHLRAHQALHAAVEKLSCSQCGKSFKKKKFHTGPYICYHCRKNYNHLRGLRSAAGDHSMKKRLKRKAFEMYSLQKRSLACSLKKQQSCDTCGKSFACPSNLYRHQRIHTGEKPFTCGTCGKSFNQLNTLKSHERIHTGEKPYVCKSCGKRFGQASGLRLHDGRHSGQNGFSCVVCGIESACVTALKLHHRTHMEEASVSCRVCEESISSLSSLQNHQNLHGGSKSHSCGICEKSFRSAGSLKIHERTHTGERPYSCSVCGRTFTQQNSLKSHQLSHTGERPFSCDVCGKGFSSAGNLSRHQRVHTGQKPYTCNVCERSFTQLNTLKAHMYVHTGEKQYTCDKCGRSFGYQRNLKSHKCPYNQ